MTPEVKAADMKKVCPSLSSPPCSLIPGSQVNGIFEMRVKNTAGKEGIYTIDFKKVSTTSDEAGERTETE
jgi:hypothetical protein